MTQIAPTAATTPAGKAFTGQLEVSGAQGAVTYALLSGAPELSVSSSGKISCPGTLAVGLYTASGSAKDSLGDSATWSFSLSVVGAATIQIAPMAATTPAGKAFSGQLEVSGSHGRVIYTESRGAPDMTVSSSGKISAPASLPAGAYKATGKDKDSLGDTGSWSFALAVVAGKLAQAAPEQATTATGKAFTGELAVSGAHGAVTYAQLTGASVLKVSPSGQVSAGAALVAGTYKATGSTRDSLGDTGSWSFALTVVAGKLTQAGPDKATTTTGKAFTGQLDVSGAHGAVTYGQSSGGPQLKVSSSGRISVAVVLPAGGYEARGTARDSLGDTGTWSFTLKVLAIKLVQLAPDTATNKAGKAFDGQLAVAGASGKVTYAQSSGAPHLTVSSSGKISAAAGLPAGAYQAKGSDKDAAGDTGSWTFTLTVKGAKLTQIAPTSATTVAGKGLALQLKVSGSSGKVTFAQTVGAAHLKVSSTGKISGVAGLAAGTYKAKGTDKDAAGDTGLWTFTLTVKGSKLTQIAPTSGTTIHGQAFIGQLKVAGAHGRITYTQATGAPVLVVSSSGSVAAPLPVPAAVYKATGTVTDSFGDTGTWTFTLIVTTGASTQAVPAAVSPTPDERAGNVAGRGPYGGRGRLAAACLRS